MYPAKTSTELNVTQFTSAPLRSIGAGQCGSVWSQSPTKCTVQGMTLVIKHDNGAPGRSLINDYQVHNHIIESLKDSRVATVFNTNTLRINVPHCEAFLDPDAPEWPRILPMLPDWQDIYRPRNALISEKIPPMPGTVRWLFAGKDHPRRNSEAEALADRAVHEHCLIRPYLGRRKMNSAEFEATKDNRQLGTSNLRNYPLYSSRMEELRLPTWQYAVAMADALAFLHWVAKVDANGVEFVLVPPRRSSLDQKEMPRQGLGEEVGPHRDMDTQHSIIAPSLGNLDFQSGCLGTHALWILDFDCCLRMTMDDRGIKRACRNFWRNDPYYPRPGRHNLYEESLWELFRAQFLDTSGKMLEQEEEHIRQLPEQLINLIEIEGRRRWARGPEASTEKGDTKIQ